MSVNQNPELNPRRAAKLKREKKRKRNRILISITVVFTMLFALVGAVSMLAGDFIPGIQRVLGMQEAPEDYEGAGEGEAHITIRSGDTGAVIGQHLENAGVVATAAAFTQYLMQNQPEAVFDIGTFQLKKKMSSEAAFNALQDPANKIQLRVTIPEGFTYHGALARLSKETDIDIAEFEAVAANYTELGVPAEFPSLEGFLFPATYEFTPDDTAQQILQKMVDRMWQALDEHGVPREDAFTVLTKAALVQREAGQNLEDFAKIARVFENRLEQGMKLESDATVAYGAGNFESVWTTPEERADASNKYNTYANVGLPAGPIGLPGDTAIEAAQNPAPGKWLFFVTVNFDTGETKFSETLAEHNVGVEQLAQWCIAHREAGGDKCD